jgi:hypothetical protein
MALPWYIESVMLHVSNRNQRSDRHAPSNESSSPGGSHPQALPEPDLSFSAHPAPIIQSTIVDFAPFWRFLPFLVDLMNEAGWPNPLAPSPLQRLHHYYELVRLLHVHRYFPPSWVSLIGFSLNITWRFPTFRTRAKIRFPPPLCRTPPRQ